MSCVVRLRGGMSFVYERQVERTRKQRNQLWRLKEPRRGCRQELPGLKRLSVT